MNLKRTYIILLALLGTCLAASAQRTDTLSLVKKIDRLMDRIRTSNIDTTYIALSPRKFMVSVGGKYATSANTIFLYPTLDISFAGMPENIADYVYVRAKNKTRTTSSFVALSYKGFSAMMAFSLGGKKKNKTFELTSSGKAFGYTIGYSKTKLDDAVVYDCRGLLFEALFASVEGKAVDLDALAADYTERGNTDIRDITSWHANAYYVFNRRKFRMGGHMKPYIIQRRSAGSFLVTADVNYSRLHTNNLFLGDKEKYNAFSAAVGAGYGFNWVPCGERFMLHASAMPAVNVYTRLTHQSYLYDDNGVLNKLEEGEDNSFRAFNNKRMKLTFSGVVKLGALFRINSRFVAGSDANFTFRKSENAAGCYMKNNQFVLRAYVGYLF